jgi:hypothetical protein
MVAIAVLIGLVVTGVRIAYAVLGEGTRTNSP